MYKWVTIAFITTFRLVYVVSTLLVSRSVSSNCVGIAPLFYQWLYTNMFTFIICYSLYAAGEFCRPRRQCAAFSQLRKASCTFTFASLGTLGLFSHYLLRALCIRLHSSQKKEDYLNLMLLHTNLQISPRGRLGL